MRLNAAALSARLEGGLDRAYLLFGFERLMIEEACDLLRQTARAQGVDEILSYTAGVDLDWQDLQNRTRSLSLFSNRQMIEVRLPTGKPGDVGSKALVSFLEEDHEDTILVVVAGRLEKRMQITRWFKILERVGTVVEAPPVPAKKLPQWIGQRLNDRDLQSESGVAERLAFFVEGNLLAAAQEIDKLALLLPADKVLTVQFLEKSITDHARFSVFHFVDACLGGNPERTLRVLGVLRREGAEPVLVIWSLAREVRQMAQMASELESGQSRQTVFRRYQVWSSRTACVGGALARHPASYWYRLLSRLATVDRVAKGRKADVGGAWGQLEQVALSVCGINTVPGFV